MPFATNERINNKYVRKSNKSGFDVTLSQFNYILLLFFCFHYYILYSFHLCEKAFNKNKTKKASYFI